MKRKSIKDLDKDDNYVALTPVDNATGVDQYLSAIRFALRKGCIRNIAITGPYGSGKSSIIKTFEKSHSKDYKFLNISLASFAENETSNDNRNNTDRLIERSILQQMLYGADANKLPYSRFKRILTPKFPLLKCGLVLAWITLVLASLKYGSFISDIALSIQWHLWEYVGILLMLSYLAAIPVVLLTDVYRSSFGLSLRKISLKNAEIETTEASEDSILNRHLDEIIYFFQVMNYDAVVIEDLDRFGSPEVFVKLREINKLINGNKTTGGNIKFIYALKDDMFINKNRAKFFDFIIPIVPVINNSNSLDKISERIKGRFYVNEIDKQFLREVSLLLNDLRLIHNIINEFEVYYSSLRSEKLNTTKLLAMIIYKNVYPNDFENLHHEKGTLFKICGEKASLIRKKTTELKDKISSLKESLDLIENEKARSIQELVNAYIGHILTSIEIPVNHIYGLVINNERVPYNELNSIEKIEALLSQESIEIESIHRKTILKKTFSQVEEEINPGETFRSRIKNIENRRNRKDEAIRGEIRNLEVKINELPRIKISELTQVEDINLKSILTEHLKEDTRLFIYLVKNGYIDDTYYLYISKFYEGRMTGNDHDYIISIRSFTTPPPDQIIDSPAEVCAIMRPEDFTHSYILNVSLIDYLLERKKEKFTQLKSALSFISNNFTDAEKFLSAYLTAGKNLDQFIYGLSHEWPRFAAAALNSSKSAELISYILRFVEPEYVVKQMNSENKITNYLNESGEHVFASNLESPSDFDVLKDLEVSFLKLETLGRNSLLVDYAHENNLYQINPKNVLYVLEKYRKNDKEIKVDPERSNYTYIISHGSEYLRMCIEANISVYVDKTMLVLPKNTQETDTAILNLLRNEKLDKKQKHDVIKIQEHIFESLNDIPEEHWNKILRERKVRFNWENISTYLEYERFNDKLLTEIMSDENIVNALTERKMSRNEFNEDKVNKLSSFIVKNNDLPDALYKKLIADLPYWYKTFFVTSLEKRHILANYKRVRLTEESFTISDENDFLKYLLIERNFEIYSANKDKYPIGDDIRELLLDGKLDTATKSDICHDIADESILNSVSLATLVARTLSADESDISDISDSILSAAIKNTKNLKESLSLLIKCIPDRNEKFIISTLAEIDAPYCDIASYGKRPRLESTSLNISLAEALDSKKIVSSIKKDDSSIRINTWKSPDHKDQN